MELLCYVGEPAQALAPEAFERVQPLAHACESIGCQVVVPLPPAGLVADQLGAPEHLQVLRNGGAAELELVGQISRGARPVRQQLQQRDMSEAMLLTDQNEGVLVVLRGGLALGEALTCGGTRQGTWRCMPALTLHGWTETR